MKLAIVGSRNFNSYILLHDTILKYFGSYSDITIVSGGADGADFLGESFADNYHWLKEIYLPDWNKYSRAAGFIRNQQIVDACDMVLAFWDGVSKGTKDTIDKARKAKKPTFIVYF